MSAAARQTDNNPRPPNRILVIVGPTGVGKSEMAASLAERIGAEIVCADAFQAYRGLEILTAQPGSELTSRAPHHLYGTIPVTESLDAAAFAERARAVMEGILSRGRTVLLVGGSGLYLRAILEGFDPLPPVDTALRARLTELPLEELQRQLREADPAALDAVDSHNPRRVQRALEIVLQTGRSLASARAHAASRRLPHSGWYLARSREALDRRIASNVARMFERGVVPEARRLASVGATASKAIGWREVRAVAEGQLTEEAARTQITAATRAYAKRQRTWFRNQTNYLPMVLEEAGDPGPILDALITQIRKS